MPANMMNAATGSSPYVTGSSSATAIAGPMPGSTPMAVPSSTPRAAHSRLSGVRAVPNPSMRELRAFMSEHSHQRTAGQRHAEQLVEDDIGDQGQHRGDQRIAVHAAAAEGEGGAPEEQGPGDGEAGRLDQGGGAEEDPGQQQHRAPVGRFGQVDVLAALRLAPAPAQHVDGEQRGYHQQAGA